MVRPPAALLRCLTLEVDRLAWLVPAGTSTCLFSFLPPRAFALGQRGRRPRSAMVTRPGQVASWRCLCCRCCFLLAFCKCNEEICDCDFKCFVLSMRDSIDVGVNAVGC